MVNDDSWSRCTTALRRTQQHANSSPLMWLCGDAREAGPAEKSKGNDVSTDPPSAVGPVPDST